jgi:hypothetical protein
MQHRFLLDQTVELTPLGVGHRVAAPLREFYVEERVNNRTIPQRGRSGFRRILCFPLVKEVTLPGCILSLARFEVALSALFTSWTPAGLPGR